MDDGNTIGDRIAAVRKRRGLSQRELAKAAGVSESLISKTERGQLKHIRMETAHQLAIALRVRTTVLLPDPAADQADNTTADHWDSVRRALFEPALPDEQDMPSPDGVMGLMNSAKPAIAANRFRDVSPLLPGLIRDSEMLDNDNRHIRSRILNMTAWLLSQTRQWESAETASQLAMDAAPDRLEAGAAVNTLCWSLLRQGRLAEARELAVTWADRIEPRFSRATVRELSIWGRLWLNVANAAVRDNRPGEAHDAMQLAKAAAERVGREVLADGSTTRTFGPVTVAMIAAECAAIKGDPNQVLDIAQQIPPNILHPRSASRSRHKLDIAHAYMRIRQYNDAISVMSELHADVPEWLLQQKYARDILDAIVRRRRTLTPQMRMLADAVQLPL